MKFIVKVTVAIILVIAFLPWACAPDVQPELQVQPEQCHVVNIYYEAKGEPIQGKQAVLEVVNNRTKAKGYPSSVCGVVFQNKQFSWTHQQKFKDIEKLILGDTTGLNQKDRQAYNQALIIAYTQNNARLKVLPEGTMFYHANYVKPRWSNRFKKVKMINKHVFYMK